NVATAQSRTIATGVIDGASFAPGTSDQVVYARAAVNTTRVNIYTTSASGTHTSQLTNDGLSEYPLWGPNGIVYSRETLRPKNPYPALQLWFIGARGGTARRLTDIAVKPQVEGLTPIAFSADGKHLLAHFVGPQGSDQAEAYAVDLSGPKAAAPRNLTGQSNGSIGDAISADGKTILLTKGIADNLAPLSIETLPWAGGKPKPVIAQDAYASWDLYRAGSPREPRSRLRPAAVALEVAPRPLLCLARAVALDAQPVEPGDQPARDAGADQARAADQRSLRTEAHRDRPGEHRQRRNPVAREAQQWRRRRRLRGRRRRPMLARGRTQRPQRSGAGGAARDVRTNALGELGIHPLRGYPTATTNTPLSVSTRRRRPRHPKTAAAT